MNTMNWNGNGSSAISSPAASIRCAVLAASVTASSSTVTAAVERFTAIPAR